MFNRNTFIFKFNCSITDIVYLKFIFYYIILNSFTILCSGITSEKNIGNQHEDKFTQPYLNDHASTSNDKSKWYLFHPWFFKLFIKND